MDPTLLQRLISEIDLLSTKVWDLAQLAHTSAARIGVLQKILIILISGMVALSWTIFSKK